MPAKKTKKTKSKAKMNPGENSISRHKTTPARLEPAQAAASPVFDIIPRTRVRPSASSRPVITSNQPAVADTTLRQPGPAPQLDIPQPNLDPVAETPKKALAPEEKGVLVADLVAKKQAAATVPEPVAPSTAQAAPAEAPVEAVEPEKPKEKTMVHEKTIQPPQQEAGNSAAADAAPELQDTPAEDSLANALKDDSTGSPPEQTDELKDAIKDMDSSSLRHHELYEGKPVIVVHKHHTGKHPALAWTVWFLMCLAIALLAVNLLLDAEVISTEYVIPHTDFL